MAVKCKRHPENTIDDLRGIVCQSCIAGLPPTLDTKDQLGERKRSLIEIEFTRTKKIEKHLAAIGKDLGRIATALEVYLAYEYSYQSKPLREDTSGPEPQVTFTNQDEYDINEIVEEMGEK